jgi:hypothetical protein
MRIFLLFVAALFVFSSCSVNQTMNLNADQSGSVFFKIYYATLAGMSKTDSTEYDPFAGINVDSVVRSINKIEGISRAELSKDPDYVYFSYQFKDLTALNKAMNQSYLASSFVDVDPKTVKPHTYFSGTAHSLTYTAQTFDKATLEKSKESLVMAILLTIETKINLPGKVTKLSNYNYEISADRKSISHSVAADKILNGEVNTDFTVKF